MTIRLHDNRAAARLLMAALCLAAACAVLPLLPGTGSAAGLPPEILKDKYEIIVERHLATRSYDRAARYMARMAQLRDEYGVELDEGFDFKRAQIHYQLRRYEDAARFLTDYLAKTGKSGQFYQQALDLLVDAETAAEDVAERRQAVTDQARVNQQARQTTSQVAAEAAQTQAAMARAARQAQLRQMAQEAQRQQAAQAAPAPQPAKPDAEQQAQMAARQAALGQQFAALIAPFRFDSEAQAVDGNPARRYVFRMQAQIDQQAQAGPGPCELSFSSAGAYAVERTGLTHAGTREQEGERVAQARIGGEVIGMNAADLRFNETDQLHKAFNVYTFTAGDAQKITIYGAGGYMLRLYDIATAWGKACNVN